MTRRALLFAEANAGLCQAGDPLCDEFGQHVSLEATSYCIFEVDTTKMDPDSITAQSTGQFELETCNHRRRMFIDTRMDGKKRVKTPRLARFAKYTIK